MVRRRPTDAERRKKRATDRRRARRLTREHKERLRREIKSKKQELSLIKKGSGVTKDRAHSIERKRRKKSVQQEIYELERELRAAKKRRLGSAPAAQPAPQLVREPGMGALPDFVIIGAMKGGTSYFYHLLTQHPLVEPASAKELHFFESHFDLGVEWYRRCFPPPRWEDGQWTITGEATPGYLPNGLVPERMAKVVPQARLIALLRNPVDRTYSQYQQVTRKGRQTLTFEEAIGVKKRRPGVGGETSDEGGDDLIGLAEARHKYLSKSIYVDQLLRWSEFFPKEQMLVLKSEDFFENPVEAL